MGYKLSISNERLAHMRSVGRRAQIIAEQIGIEDTEELEDIFILGYLHDIGYEFSNAQSGHERVGGNILRRNGYRYWREVSSHGDPDAIYSSKLLDILNAADMLTDSEGESVTYEERLLDISKRYGADSSQYVRAAKLIESLVGKGYALASSAILFEREDTPTNTAPAT